MSKCQTPNKKKDISLVPDQHAYCQKNQGSCVSQPTAPTSAFNLYFPAPAPNLYLLVPPINLFLSGLALNLCLSVLRLTVKVF